MRGPDGQLTTTGQAWVTIVCMGFSCVTGFIFQQKLIEEYVSRDGKGELHMMAKEIHRLEMLELQQKAEQEAAQKAKAEAAATASTTR